MIRINLLPHREMRRERRKKEFVGLIGLTGVAAAAAAFAVGMVINGKISIQTERNDFIKTENAKLDQQIKQIATLRQEIESLKTRQQAVEALQSDRTVPVHILDELVKQTPEGIFLKQAKQEDKKVTMIGWAQSQDRIAELWRNFANRTPWLERPDLMESKAVTIGSATSKDQRQVFEFAINVLVKSNAAKDANAAVPKAPGKSIQAANSVK